MSDNGCTANWPNSVSGMTYKATMNVTERIYKMLIDKLEQNIEFLSEQVHSAEIKKEENI